jgi:hypothetical protein
MLRHIEFICKNYFQVKHRQNPIYSQKTDTRRNLSQPKTELTKLRRNLNKANLLHSKKQHTRRVKAKAIPVQARAGHAGSRRVRSSDFKKIDA